MNIYSFIYYVRSAESICSYCMEVSYSILLQVTNGALAPIHPGVSSSESLLEATFLKCPVTSTADVQCSENMKG